MADFELSDAQKEQIKLRATFLNNIGIGVMLIGVFTPIIRTLYGESAASIALPLAALPPVACFLVALALHFVATKLLGRLTR